MLHDKQGSQVSELKESIGADAMTMMMEMVIDEAHDDSDDGGDDDGVLGECVWRLNG